MCRPCVYGNVTGESIVVVAQVTSGPTCSREVFGLERDWRREIAADKNVNGPRLCPPLFSLVPMSLLPTIEVTVPPRRFPSGYVDGVRPSHHTNNTKTKFANPWQSFRLVAMNVYASLLNPCRFQPFLQLLSVRDFARDTYCLIKHLHLGGSI